MAQADHDRLFQRLRLHSNNNEREHEQHAGEHDGDHSLPAEDSLGVKPSVLSRPPFRGSAASQETIRATPPMDIPAGNDAAMIEEDPANPSTYINHYMRRRNPSVSFNTELTLESGHRQSMLEPLEKPSKAVERGRSLQEAMAGERQSSRAHSESERSHFDSITGRHLPKYSQSPRRDEPRVGEERFPLLQTTVDALARESQPDLSSNDQVITPPDDSNYLSSPAAASPISAAFSSQTFSFEELKPFRRTASQRWREGDTTSSPQDFFSRAGSLRKSMRDMAGRPSRRDTSGSFTRSPRSAASSYLRGFSLSSGTNGDGTDPGPLACDAEGQTIGDDYVLGKQIGFGGFSTIKQVTQLRNGEHRKLAVKIVRRQIEGKHDSDNEQAQAEFEHEVELWRFLNHPNVLPLEAVYKLDEATFCFIPLNHGGTLFDLVRANRRGVPLEMAKSYSYQLASALRYLHLDARVVHRDVKLENCLIEPTADGEPGLLRVCDFGMAEWLSTDSNLGPPSPDFNRSDRPPPKYIGPADTSTSAFAGGSLEYAAPEILRLADHNLGATAPERAIVSPAVDLWAYGVCVYSMVVGSRPFQNSFQPRIVMAILAGDWNRLILEEKGGNDAYEMVSGCLEMDASARWDITRVVDCSWLEDLAGEENGAERRPNDWRW